MRYSEMSLADLRKERQSRKSKINRAHDRIVELEVKINREMAINRFITSEINRRASGR